VSAKDESYPVRCEITEGVFLNVTVPNRLKTFPPS
jgi:hypothetical protein